MSVKKDKQNLFFTIKSPLAELLHYQAMFNLIRGTNKADELDGTNGRDKILGRGGADVMKGGNGNDVMKGGNGRDEMHGGDGNDVMRGGNGHDNIWGDDGRDDIKGGRKKDVLRGNDGDDTLKGNGGHDRLVGGQGYDKLYGGNGKDSLVYNIAVNQDNSDVTNGYDIYNGGRGRDTLKISLDGDVSNDLFTAIKAFQAASKNTYFDFSDYVSDMKLKVIHIEKIHINGKPLIITETDSSKEQTEADSSNIQTDNATDDTNQEPEPDENLTLAPINGTSEPILSSPPENNPGEITASSESNESKSDESTNDDKNTPDKIDGTDSAKAEEAIDTSNISPPPSNEKPIHSFLKTLPLDQQYIYIKVDGNYTSIQGNDSLHITNVIAWAKAWNLQERDLYNYQKFYQEIVEAVNIVGIENGGYHEFNYKGQNNLLGIDVVVNGIEWFYMDVGSNLYETADDVKQLFIDSFNYDIDTTVKSPIYEPYVYITPNETAHLNKYIVGQENNNDSIATGSGDDLIYTYGGDDYIESKAGNDTIHSGDGNDTIKANGGDNIIYAGRGVDKITTGNGKDTIYAGDDADKVESGSGDDTIFGGLGTDSIYAGEGNDTIDAGGDNDRIYAGSGDDTIEHNIFTNLNNAVLTLAIDGNEVTYTDYYHGGEGNDILNITGLSQLISENVLSESERIALRDKLLSFADSIKNQTGEYRLIFSSDSGNIQIQLVVDAIEELTLEGNTDVSLDKLNELLDIHEKQAPIDSDKYAPPPAYSPDEHNNVNIELLDDKKSYYIYAEGDNGNEEQGALHVQNVIDWAKAWYLEGIDLYNYLRFFQKLADSINKNSGFIGKFESQDKELSIAIEIYKIERLFLDNEIEGDTEYTSAADVNALFYEEYNKHFYLTEMIDSINQFGFIANNENRDQNLYIIGQDDNRDKIHTGPGNDTIYSYGGNDYIYTENGHDLVYAGDGDDIIISIGGNNRIYGMGGKDYIETGDGFDTISSGDGNDTVIAGGDTDMVYTGSGNDTITHHLLDNLSNDILVTKIGQERNVSFSDYFDGGSDIDTLHLKDATTLMQLGRLSKDAKSQFFSALKSFVDDFLEERTIKTLQYINPHERISIDLKVESVEKLMIDNQSVTSMEDFYAVFEGIPIDESISLNLSKVSDEITVEGGQGNDTLTIEGISSLLQKMNYNAIELYSLKESLKGLAEFIINGNEANEYTFSYKNLDNVNEIVSRVTVKNIEHLYIENQAIPEASYMDVVFKYITGRELVKTSLAPDGHYHYEALEDVSNRLWVIGEDAEKDIISTSHLNDTVDSYGGDDDIKTLEGDDTIRAGSGDDTIDGGDGDDHIFGEEGHDLILGGDGNDNLHGGMGNDTIIDPLGNNIISGGDGDDLIITKPDIDRNTTIFNHTIYAGDGVDRIFSGDGDDTIHGHEGSDVIHAGGGDDTVFGDRGYDIIRGGLGNDKLYGGTGEDTLRGEDGNDTLEGHDDNDRLYGGNGVDTIRGGYGDDEIHGDAGDDILFGDAGNDTLYGGRGHDIIDGGDDDDTINGSYGSDVIRAGMGNDTITHHLLRNLYNEVLTKDIDGKTVSFTDYIDGNEGNDTLHLTGLIDLLKSDNISPSSFDEIKAAIKTLANIIHNKSTDENVELILDGKTVFNMVIRNIENLVIDGIIITAENAGTAIDNFFNSETYHYHLTELATEALSAQTGYDDTLNLTGLKALVNSDTALNELEALADELKDLADYIHGNGGDNTISYQGDHLTVSGVEKLIIDNIAIDNANIINTLIIPNLTHNSDVNGGIHFITPPPNGSNTYHNDVANQVNAVIDDIGSDNIAYDFKANFTNNDTAFGITDYFDLGSGYDSLRLNDVYDAIDGTNLSGYEYYLLETEIKNLSDYCYYRKGDSTLSFESSDKTINLELQINNIEHLFIDDVASKDFTHLHNLFKFNLTKETPSLDTPGVYVYNYDGDDNKYVYGRFTVSNGERIDHTDLIDTGNGNDIIISGGDASINSPSIDDDVIHTHNGNDIIDSGAGNDRIFSGDDNDYVISGAGDDIIYTGNGDDYANGGSGNDMLNGGEGMDALFGGMGDDTIEHRLSDNLSNELLYGLTDIIDGGEGTDTLKITGLSALINELDDTDRQSLELALQNLFSEITDGDNEQHSFNFSSTESNIHMVMQIDDIEALYLDGTHIQNEYDIEAFFPEELI